MSSFCGGDCATTVCDEVFFLLLCLFLFFLENPFFLAISNALLLAFETADMGGGNEENPCEVFDNTANIATVVTVADDLMFLCD